MDSNPVLILTHNCLELTKRCVASVRAQDIPTTIVGVDNGSTDGTDEWLRSNGYRWFGFNHNAGVSKGWNAGLDWLLSAMPRDYVLVLNNDTELPPYFYRKLLSYDLPFVTGISVDEPSDHPDAWHQPAESPDFSAFLIRRDCWEKVGPFDETMKFYASDNDYHVRAHLQGIKLMNAGVPFHHERSSTLRNSSPEERIQIEAQANADRMTFKAKWGFFPWEPAYAEFFRESPTNPSLDKTLP